MSKKKDIPAQESAGEVKNEVTQEAETFTVTKEQMEKMESLAKMLADEQDK